MEFCAYCNNKIIQSDRFCPSCGAPLKNSISSKSDIPITLKTLEDVWNAYRNLEYEKTDIHPDTYIKVVSLLSHKLNLSADGYGRKKVYSMDGVGKSVVIPFEILSEIVQNQRGFAEAPFYCIFSKKVVEILNLENSYSQVIEQLKCE